MIEEKKSGKADEPEAHEMRATATTAAATITRAYSAVAWPRSDFMAASFLWS